MAAELIPERRKQPLGEGVVGARAEPREQRGGGDREGHAAIDGFVQRLASFAGILHVSFEAGQIAILGHRARRQF